MKQIDIDPDQYRKQDPRSGRWVQNVDRRLCFWMGVAGLCFTAVMIVRFAADGGDYLDGVLFGALGLVSGALLGMASARP